MNSRVLQGPGKCFCPTGAVTKKNDWISSNYDLIINFPLYFGGQQVRVPLKVALRSRDLTVDIQKNHLKVGIKNQPPIIDDQLPHDVKIEDSTWLLEDKTTLIINMEKVGSRSSRLLEN